MTASGPHPIEHERLTPETREAIERWFVRRGVPHFIEDYSAGQHVWTRATPVLSLYLAFGLVSAANFDWPLWANVVAVIGGAVIVLGGWALLNVVEGRPALSRPTRVGPIQIAAILVLPAVPPLLIGGQLEASALTIGNGMLFLAAVYLATSYGFLPMARWAFGRMVYQVNDILGLSVRAMPLLLIFLGFTFFQNELWQIGHAMDLPVLAAVAGLFFIVGTAFLLARLPREVRQLSGAIPWAATLADAANTPAARLLPGLRAAEPVARPLTRRQWGNLGLVVVFSQGLQILVVTAVVAAFLVALGLLTAPVELQADWAAGPVAPIIDLTLFGRPLPLTGELIKVATFLGAFCALYFTVYALTDATYRTEFFEEVIGELRVVLGVRTVYLTAIDREERRTDPTPDEPETTAPV